MSKTLRTKRVRAPKQVQKTVPKAIRAPVNSSEKKLRWDLIPYGALREVVKCLTVGAEKHGANQWKTIPDIGPRYFSKGLGHLVQWKIGEGRDNETQTSHIANAIADYLILLQAELDGQYGPNNTRA